MKQTATLILALILMTNLASAVIINSVDSPTLAPGEQGQIRIEVENVFDDDAEDVSLALKFENLPFIPIGTSEQSVDKIKEDDDEEFVFTIKASLDIKPGDYEIPYLLQYKIDSTEKTRQGTIGIKVKANPDLTYSISTDSPVLDQKGKLTFKIVNKGFYDARFVSVKFLPDGFTLLSDDEVYIGTINSDDFETATFDVMFKKINADFTAIVEYLDFDNQKVVENIKLPVTVYTKEKALELGFIQRNTTLYYIGCALALIIIYLVYRSIKKRRRLRKSMENSRR